MLLEVWPTTHMPLQVGSALTRIIGSRVPSPQKEHIYRVQCLPPSRNCRSGWTKHALVSERPERKNRLRSGLTPHNALSGPRIARSALPGASEPPCQL